MNRPEHWIPVHPDEVPRQKVALVVDLPPLPAGFRARTFRDLDPHDKATPKRMPGTATHLCTVEWGWSINAFYLSPHPCRDLWIAWTSWLDDNCTPFRWRNVFLACGPLRDVPQRTAAAHLLIAGIRAADDLGPHPFFMIDSPGLLSIPQILAIRRELWPDAPPLTAGL